MMSIFKDYITSTCLLDDFDFYENRQKIMQEKRIRQSFPRRHDLQVCSFFSLFPSWFLFPFPFSPNFVTSSQFDKEERVHIYLFNLVDNFMWMPVEVQ